MHHPDSGHCHSHEIYHTDSRQAERSTLIVTIVTAIMMVIEIVAGWWFNSMALLADGWHMSSHAFAIGLSALAYVAARRFANDQRFAFGTWKIEVLGGFVSALFLLGVAVAMVAGSVGRLISPQSIHFTQAIIVAVIGLAVNLVCALILGKAHHHDHASSISGHRGHPPHDHHHDEHQDCSHNDKHEAQDFQDLNLRGAYLHVMADAATSVLAVIALLGGLWWGWTWLDPLMGIAGALLVALWAWSLLRDSTRVLLDCEMDDPLTDQIRASLYSITPDRIKIADLHVWRIARARFACVVQLITDDVSLTPARVTEKLLAHASLAHVTVEITLTPATDTSQS